MHGIADAGRGLLRGGGFDRKCHGLDGLDPWRPARGGQRRRADGTRRAFGLRPVPHCAL
ncbi:hypothetical protein AZ78_1376 [Lysobacter capsici AZ78]|uniref:Uncharacterized protein n=1 Tax=Lysobacter capsici AZ78 TaxID=1444315 RepID=A0A108U786_9GAMM|nr:hypothetical protein AZ78_1376 [Lysobacter capsici AZ78]